ncbi:hypothetical protein Ahy_B01g055594 [Arachis hypogaea]|uniref:Potassium channel domain-containing protein n=1 Tax=Arachis hypogaea TaxID=3818 RepID=A0A445AWK4_ARAHY|nr:hypothetical protein Ahy_B01g055594 [Arachis hypogaea]
MAKQQRRTSVFLKKKVIHKHNHMGTGDFYDMDSKNNPHIWIEHVATFHDHDDAELPNRFFQLATSNLPQHRVLDSFFEINPSLQIQYLNFSRGGHDDNDPPLSPIPPFIRVKKKCTGLPLLVYMIGKFKDKSNKVTLSTIGYGKITPSSKSAVLAGPFVFSIGAVIVHCSERMSWLDSFYFSVISITTVGYGDYSFKTPDGERGIKFGTEKSGLKAWGTVGGGSVKPPPLKAVDWPLWRHAWVKNLVQEKVKQLEEMLIKRNEDCSKLKKDSVLRISSSLRSSFAGLSIVASISTFSACDSEGLFCLSTLWSVFYWIWSPSLY